MKTGLVKEHLKYGFNGSYVTAIPTKLHYTVLGRPPVRCHFHVSNLLAFLVLTHNIHIPQLTPNAAHSLQLLEIITYYQIQWNWENAINRLAGQGKQVTKYNILEHYAEATLWLFPQVAGGTHGATRNVELFRRFAELSQQPMRPKASLNAMDGRAS